MLTTKHKIIKTKTIAGDLAKHYVSLLKEDEDSEEVILIVKYILSKTPLPSSVTFKLVKTYKGSKLYMQRIAITKNTFGAIVNSINSIFNDI